MSSFCPLPFNHTAINTRGYYNICCQHRTPEKHQFHLTEGDFNDWQQNEYCQEVKTSFKEGKQHPGCSLCWNKEKEGLTSLRQRVFNEYKILGSANSTHQSKEKLLNIEVCVGNLCNLSCLMCNEMSSSVILAENTKLKINQYTQQDFTWDSDNFVALAKNLALKPKVINLRGGEPLYNKKIFQLLDSLDSNFIKDTVIHITTNATTWDDKWAAVFSKFKLVRMMLSVDAVGSLYNYIRYPGNFQQVELNIKKIITHKKIKPIVYSTVQNLNILYIGELVEWCNNLGLYLSFDKVDHPEYLHFTNLPPDIKLKSINHLDHIISTLPNSHVSNELISYKKSLENSEFDQQRWMNFLSNISLRDNIRGNSFKDFLY